MGVSRVWSRYIKYLVCFHLAFSLSGANIGFTLSSFNKGSGRSLATIRLGDVLLVGVYAPCCVTSFIGLSTSVLPLDSRVSFEV